MASEQDSADRHAWKIRERLLQIRRFAITRAKTDHIAVLSLADELDALGGQWRPTGPRFFLRASEEVCAAIRDGNTAMLWKHAARIDDLRLRQTFQAAAGLQEPLAPVHQIKTAGQTAQATGLVERLKLPCKLRRL